MIYSLFLGKDKAENQLLMPYVPCNNVPRMGFKWTQAWTELSLFNSLLEALMTTTKAVQMTKFFSEGFILFLRKLYNYPNERSQKFPH